jgi:hypothetical protein
MVYDRRTADRPTHKASPKAFVRHGAQAEQAAQQVARISRREPQAALLWVEKLGLALSRRITAASR